MLCLCGHERSQHPRGDGTQVEVCDYAGYSCHCSGFSKADPLAKPAPRGPKPRQRIMRASRPARVRQRGGQGKLRELADDFMSLYVRHRDGWTCWSCGSRDWRFMQCAHVMGKGPHPTLRYRDDNARCLCDRCHKRFTHNSTLWRMFLVEKLGTEDVERRERDALIYQGPQDYTLQALIYRRLLLARPDVWKVQDRLDALDARARKLNLVW
jgi:5-methylcytosine-specific restriction endonuclease McrA